METKRDRLWYWLCNRGFAFAGYVAISISASLVWYESRNTDITVDVGIAVVAALMALTLVLAGLASAHAVIYGIGPCNSFMIKLEIPSLRILAVIVALHGVLDIFDGNGPSGFLQISFAALLLHEMRAISAIRKAPHGGLIAHAS